MDVINFFILKKLNWKIIMTEKSEKKKKPTNLFEKQLLDAFAKSKTGKFSWGNWKAQDEEIWSQGLQEGRPY